MSVIVVVVTVFVLVETFLAPGIIAGTQLLFNSHFNILCHFEMIITKTCLYNSDPLKTHFYIVKLGFTGVYIIFLISDQKHRLWVLVRTASMRRF